MNRDDGVDVVDFDDVDDNLELYYPGNMESMRGDDHNKQHGHHRGDNESQTLQVQCIQHDNQKYNA